MLTLQSLLSLPVFLSTSLISHALAAQGGFVQMKGEGPSLDEYAVSFTGGERCNENQLRAIRAGFIEMHDLFASALPFNPDGEAERELFGDQSRISNYTSLIEANLRRAADYANSPGNGTRMPDIHVRCDDPNDLCDEGNRKQGRHTAYNIGNDPHINFCKRYFGLDGMREKVDIVAANVTMNLELMAYYNRATAWARQLMHISSVGVAVVETAMTTSSANFSNTWMTQMSNAPMNTSFLAGVQNERPKTDGPNDVQALKYAYGATRVKLLASFSTQEPYDAANNAESYALFAQARYVLQKKNFYPSLPAIVIENEVAMLADNELQEGERRRFAYFDVSDVVQRNAQTNAIGAPIESSASLINGLHNQRNVLWIMAYVSALTLFC